MTDLIFLPIEIDIVSTKFCIDRSAKPTFRGLWETKELSETEISESQLRNITDQLPFRRITLAKYNTQTATIPPHVDVQSTWTKTLEEYDHIRNNEPAGYRVVLVGKIDSLEVFDNRQWKKARLPTVPFAYVLNSTEYKHRVEGEIGRQTLYFRGFLDEKKHKEIIEINLKKYQNYAVFSQ